MWGIIPAAGAGSRIQPLSFSKELLPVGSRFDGAVERPRAVSEYLVERLVAAGATKLCFVVSPGKSDILEYYGGAIGGAQVCYLVQEHPAGLCDALFRARPFIAADEEIVIGLPDTVWFPSDALRTLPSGVLSLLLFPVECPQFFDAVVTDDEHRVLEIQVKRADAASHWVWGAFRMPGFVFGELYDLWSARERADEYMGTLINAYLAAGGRAIGLQNGESYVDVGTLNGYRHAVQLLGTPELVARETSIIPHL
ncbi:MAG TPA: nucleotidyltransferase family protein, partial [Gemmatimonadaceae bacterium]|nr:nucleotidyltransferase family protein [Gemmatimonadaceae bacterium]